MYIWFIWGSYSEFLVLASAFSVLFSLSLSLSLHSFWSYAIVQPSVTPIVAVSVAFSGASGRKGVSALEGLAITGSPGTYRMANFVEGKTGSYISAHLLH